MIAEVETSAFDVVGKEIDELIAAFNRQDNIDIVSRMKSLVPEYKSNNSVFEQLDEPTR